MSQRPTTVELVCLALFDHGPLTLTALAEMTCLPLPCLRDHLRLNHGDRYISEMAEEHGIPVRRWSLAPTPNVGSRWVDPDVDILIIPESYDDA